MIRICLISCGVHSRKFHAPALARYAAEYPGEIELAAVCDPDLPRAEGFCREFGFAKAYADWREMLEAEKPGAVMSAAPTSIALELGTHLLEAGITCMLEKPLGMNLDEVRRLAAVAKKTGAPHLVSVNRRYSPYLNAATEFCRAAGPMRYIRATMLRDRRDEDDFIWTTALHSLDAMMHVAGEVRDYEARPLRHKGMTGWWYAIDLEFAGGCIGRLDVAPTCGVLAEVCEIFGDDYRALVEMPGPGGWSARCWRRKRLELNEAAAADEPEFVSAGSYNEVQKLVQLTRGEVKPYPTVLDVLSATEICFKVADMIKSGPSGDGKA